jgi:hypothetical protein
MEVSEELKRANAKSKVHVGAAYYINDLEADKLKMHVIVGISKDRLTSVAVRINSEINKWTPQNERGYHVPIAQRNNTFLKYDSHLNCSKLLQKRSIDELTEYFYNNPAMYLGQLNEADVQIARITIAKAHTIENATRELYGLNLQNLLP